MKRLERAWVGSLNSPTWRRVAALGLTQKALRSSQVQQAKALRRRADCWYARIRDPHRYDGVETMSLFVGHMKSGGTMLGALLDAHPQVTMSDELDVLALQAQGLSKRDIFHLIERSARREALKGRVTARRLTPYSFEVPGQWQGRNADFRVMGDTKAGITTQRLATDPAALERLDRALDGVRVKLIHVVRNPFDPIALMRIRGKRTFEDAVFRYFDNCRILYDVHASVPPSDIEVVAYEQFVSDPSGHLDRVCRHLGVEPHPDYLAACAAVIGDSRTERQRVPWADNEIEHIQRRISEFPFLAGYSFEHSGGVS